MKVCTAAQMRAIDRRTIETFGIPGMVLMERAGLAVTLSILDRPSPLRKACVVCGTGNNGGDGFVVARELARRDIRVQVFLIGTKKKVKGDARVNLDIVTRLGVQVREVGTLRQLSLPAERRGAVIVDALFGTGLDQGIQGLHAGVIRKMNTSSVPIVSVDIASGISADTGHILGEAVKARDTVTFGLPKVGHLLYPGALYTGRLTVADIGFPSKAVEEEDIRLETIATADIGRLLPERPVDAHKGTFGHLLLIAGSKGKAGAALLSGLAALRAGCGLVTLALPESLANEVTRKFPEAMTLPLPETREGTLSRKAVPHITGFADKVSAVAIGPGLSLNADVMALVRDVLTRVRRPTVADADAINALMGDAGFLRRIRRRVVLTPHPAELGRLIDRETIQVQADRLGTVRQFAAEFGHVLALKGAHTLVTGRKGRVYVNLTGNSGMGTAGTGDVLTGMTGALLAAGMDPFEAARASIHVHGLAGDLAAARTDGRALMARDIIGCIPEAFHATEAVPEPAR